MAGGAGGKEVGRVGVRATPLTDTFGEELEAYLEELEKRLEVRVKVTVDEDGDLTEKLDAEKEKAEKSDPVKLPVQPKMDTFQAQMLADVQRAVRGVEADIPINVQGEQFRRQLATLVEGTTRLIRADIPVGVEAATAFREQVLAQVAEVEALIRSVPEPTIPVDINVNQNRFRTFLASVSGALARIGIGGHAVDDALEGSDRAARDAAEGVGFLENTTVRLAPAVAGILTTLLQWGPPILLAAGAITTMLPAVLTLLPAFVGIGSAVGVIALTAGGLGKVFQPLVKDVTALKKPLTDIVTSGLRPLVATLSTGLAPILRTAFTGFAQTINGVLRDLTGFLGQASTLKVISSIFTGLQSSVSIFGDALVPITQALLQITAAAVPGFKLLATALSDAAGEFANWIDQASKSGALQSTITSAVRALLTVLSGLGQVIGPLIGLLAQIGPAGIQAFSGITSRVGQLVSAITPLAASLLRNRLLLTALGAALAFLGGPITGTAAAIFVLVANFDRLRSVAGILAPLTAGLRSFGSSLGSSFTAILPGLQALGAKVLPPLRKLGTQLISVIGPGLASFGRVLRSQVAPALGAFLAAIAPLAGLLVKVFGGTVLAVVKGFFGIVNGLATVLAGVLNVIAGLLTGNWSRVWEGAKQVVVGFAKGVFAILKALLESPLGQLFGFILTGIGHLFAGLAGLIVKGVSAAVSGIGSLASTIGDALAGFGTELVSRLGAELSGVAGFFGRFFSAIGAGLAAEFHAVVGVLTAIWSAFWSSAFGQLVSAAIGLVVAFVRLDFAVIEGLFFAAAAVLEVVWRGLWSVISAVAKVAWAVITTVIKVAWSVISSVVSAGVHAVEAVLRAGFNAMKSVVSAAWNGIKAATTAVWGFIRPYVTAAVAGVVVAVRGIERVVAIVGDAFRSAYDAVTSWIGKIVGVVGGIGSRVVHAIGNFGSLLFDAGAKLIQGLIDGITSRIKKVTDVINGLTGKIKSFFPGSPIKEGPLVSWNNGGAGKRLVDLLADGLSDTGAIDDAMDALSRRVAVRAPNLDFGFGAAGTSSAGPTVQVGTVIGEDGIDYLIRRINEDARRKEALQPVFG